MATYDNINDFLSEYGSNLSSFNTSLASEQQKIINTLSSISSSVLQDLKKVLTDVLQLSDSNLTKIIDIEIERRNELARLQQEEQIIQNAIQQSKQKSAQEELKAQLDIIEQKKELAEEEAEIKKAQLESDDAHYKEIMSNRRAREADEKAADEQTLEHKQKYNNAVKGLTDFLSKGLQEFTSTYTTAINNVANSYNQNAGKLAAILNSSTSDIRTLQQNVAEGLRDTNLNEAISNVAVMNEATKLAAEGYSNELKLQQTATDIVTAEKIAPGINFESATVKNLINVFGSDFTHKFASIQQAVQETAGSTANLSENLQTLMADLEPVYLAAGDEALQGMADVQATLSAAIESGLISESNAKEYQRMIADLMDPSKAFKSSNVAVRLAATSYDWSNTDPAVALAAILAATGQMYGGLSTTGSSSDRIAASLLAGVYGQNTMTAAYNLGAYTDVSMVSTRDLANIYSEKEASLESGKYTTATERIANEAENSNFVQKVASFSEEMPRIYKLASSTIVSAINNLPGTLATLLRVSGGFGGGSSEATSGLGIFSKMTPTGAARVLGGIGTAASLVNIVGGAFTDGKFSASGLFKEGDIASSTMSWAGLGASIGTIFGPGLGTLIGGGIGGLVGLIGSLIVKNTEATEENTEATDEQTSMTEEIKNVFGEGITGLTEMQAKQELARGGGLLQLPDGKTYAMDLSSIKGAAEGMAYVPYDDYLVRAHKGEAIVTASAASELRKADPNFWRTPSTIFNADNDKVVDEIHQQTNDLVSAFKGEEKYTPMQRVQPQTFVLQNANI